jgi:hypothetical protein
MEIIRNTFYNKLFCAAILALTFSSVRVIAQDVNKFSIGIKAGPALPFGQLASQHYNTGGYALTGQSAVAEGIWYVYPEFGIGISVSATSFPFADGAYAHDMVNNDPFMESLYLKSDRYQVRTIAIGVYYNRLISGKFLATGKLAGGLFRAQTPDHLYSASYFTIPNFAFKVSPSHSTAAMLQTGLVFKYNLYEQVGISLNADYTLAVPAFGFRTSTKSYIKKLTFSYLNTLIGIDFRF